MYWRTSTSLKRKHIRPSGGGRNRKRQRLANENGEGVKIKNEDIDYLPAPDVAHSSSEVMLEPLDMTSPSDETTASKSSTVPSVMQSYYEWTLEEPWNRSLKQIEQSCNTSDSVIRDFYRKELYPKRKELLNFLQNSRIELVTDGNEGESMTDPKAKVLFSNFASVAPLMLTAKR